MKAIQDPACMFGSFLDIVHDERQPFSYLCEESALFNFVRRTEEYADGLPLRPVCHRTRFQAPGRGHGLVRQNKRSNEKDFVCIGGLRVVQVTPKGRRFQTALHVFGAVSSKQSLCLRPAHNEVQLSQPFLSNETHGVDCSALNTCLNSHLLSGLNFLDVGTADSQRALR